MRNGYGEIYWLGKGNFTGFFEKDVKTKGVFTFNDGTVYKGHFKNDKLNGFGFCVYKNGDKCEGDFEDSVLNG